MWQGGTRGKQTHIKCRWEGAVKGSILMCDYVPVDMWNHTEVVNRTDCVHSESKDMMHMGILGKRKPNTGSTVSMLELVSLRIRSQYAAENRKVK